MGGLAGGLLGGGKKGGSSSSVSTVQVPAWLDTRNKDLVKRADTLSQQAFTPYTDQRIADFTQDAQSAFDLTRNNIGAYGGLFDQASSSVYDLISRSQGPSSADIQSRMNPYLDNVLGIAKRGVIDDYGLQQAEREREAGMINAFGGSRVAIRQGLADEQLAEDLSDLDYKGRFDAYDIARNQFNRDTDVLASGIGSALQTGTAGQAYNNMDINQLLRQGELQRLKEQDQLDFNFQEFDREQAFPYENINFLANIMNPLTGAYAGGTTTGQQNQGGGGSSTLGNIAGIASSAASLASVFGFSDERLKENIQQVGELENGLPIYSYNFKGSPQTEIGLIAQDVEQVKPEAVAENQDGLKMVNYEDAVELRDGGPVGANEASKARLAGVAPIGRTSMPGLPPIPAEVPGSTLDIDALGLEEILRGSEDEGGFGGIMGWFDGVDPNHYTDPIGPTQAPNIDGFYGLSGQVTPSILSAFGFADGGAVHGQNNKPILNNSDGRISTEETITIRDGDKWVNIPTIIRGQRVVPGIAEKAYSEGFNPAVGEFDSLEEAENAAIERSNMLGQGYADGGRVSPFKERLEDEARLRQHYFDSTPEFEIDPEKHSKAGIIARKFGSAINDIPAVGASIPSYLASGYNKMGDMLFNAADPTIQELFVTPSAEVDRGRAERKEAKVEEAVEDKSLKDSIAGLFGRGDDKQLTPEDLTPIDESQLTDGTPAPQVTTANLAQPRQKGGVMDNLPDWITPYNKPQEAPKREESRSKGINMPLLIAGLTMLGTDGDSGEKLIAGLNASTKYAGDTRRAELERQKAEADKRRQDMLDYLTYIKTQAYIKQVEDNAKKGDGLTPYQIELLKRKDRNLDLQELKIQNKQDDDGLLDFDPLDYLDVDTIEDILKELQ